MGRSDQWCVAIQCTSELAATYRIGARRQRLGATFIGDRTCVVRDWRKRGELFDVIAERVSSLEPGLRFAKDVIKSRSVQRVGLQRQRRRRSLLLQVGVIHQTKRNHIMHMQTGTPGYTLNELDKEARMGGMGEETHVREVRIIDISDFEQRKAEIARQIWDASVDIGFFQISGHGIAQSDIDAAFERAEQFFALPNNVKAQWPLSRNAGWEHKAQIRPSTQTPDQKESYQVTRPRMSGLWPSEQELPGFQAATLVFERQCWEVGMRVLSCFAYHLGFDDEFFTRAHDPQSPGYQSTLRMLHYFAVDPAIKDELGLWRAGAHTDFDCLTLLFQRAGQGGLQVLPGKEMESRQWTPVKPVEGVITCNIGDMLTRWSDDQLPSNFHRVRNPLAHEYQGPRYSLAFFCQANEDAVIQGPAKKYPPITGGEYLRQRISANFSNKY